MSRLLRTPALHFLLAGGLLFAGRAALHAAHGREGSSPQDRGAVVVTSADRARLEREFERRFGAPPSPDELRPLVADFVDQEILYREAKRMALDYRDGSVRRRLVEKMRAVSDRPGRSQDELVREARQLGLDDDVVVRRLLAEEMRLVLRSAGGAGPTERELREVLEANRRDFVQPPRRSVSQVFLDVETHGDALEEDAARTLAALRSHTDDPAWRASLSDAFPLGLELPSTTRLDLQARFGKSFADDVFALQPGLWCGPIRSPYGVHLVRVSDVRAESLPSIDEIRPRLAQLAMSERGDQNVAEGLARLRALYGVRMDDTPASR